jgi:acetoin utilization deacetylase AcuC-like enzyme
MGSMGLAAAAGTLLGRNESTNAASLPPKVLKKAPAPPVAAAPQNPQQALSLIYDRDYLLYEGPKVGTAFESPTRLQAIVKRLEQTGVSVKSQAVSAASYEQIARVHTPRYVKYIKNAAYLPHDEYAMIRKVEKRLVSRPSSSPTADPSAKPVFESVIRYVRTPQDAPRYSKLRPYEAASLAAGGAVQAVDEVMNGQSKTSFALLRPPGHHATRSRNMGFCVFNNAAVAARHAQVAHGAKRVLIVDWDVHHGNGTQEIFYTDPSVLYFSTHQDNIYPKRTGKLHEVGTKAGKGYNINVPLPPGTGDEGYLRVFREVLVPVAKAFQPDLIIVSAGQDAHEGEFVASMRVTYDGYAQMTRVLKDLAGDLCDSKLVFVLEGGYNPRVTAQSVETIVKELQKPHVGAAELAASQVGGRVPRGFEARLAQVKQTHLAHWPVLA